MSRHVVADRPVGRGAAGLVLALLLTPFVLLISAGSANAVETLCLPGPDKACIAGTLRIAEEGGSLLPDVKLTITDAAGNAEEVTTGETGKWNLQVDKEGPYVVKVDESTLPDDVVVTNPEVTVDAVFGATKPALITIRTEGYSSGTSKVDELLQSSVNGLRLGLLLALASVGLSLIYGTTGLSNFAHAEQVTLGGILGYFIINQGGLGVWVGGLVVVALCAFTGYGQDRILWQPLRRRGLGLTQMMIVTIGLSLALQYVYQYAVGARTVRVLQENPSVSTFG